MILIFRIDVVEKTAATSPKKNKKEGCISYDECQIFNEDD